jgi:hypothetical protein
MAAHPALDLAPISTAAASRCDDLALVATPGTCTLSVSTGRPPLERVEEEDDDDTDESGALLVGDSSASSSVDVVMDVYRTTLTSPSAPAPTAAAARPDLSAEVEPVGLSSFSVSATNLSPLALSPSDLNSDPEPERSASSVGIIGTVLPCIARCVVGQAWTLSGTAAVRDSPVAALLRRGWAALTMYWIGVVVLTGALLVAQLQRWCDPIGALPCLSLSSQSPQLNQSKSIWPLDANSSNSNMALFSEQASCLGLLLVSVGVPGTAPSALTWQTEKAQLV